jgi:enoyl-CoA hydratase/carnithine racemase
MSNASEGAVVLERRGKLAWIALNRPHKLNSINDDVREQSPQALMTAEAEDEVRVLVLQSASDRAFCAGADVAAFAQPESPLAVFLTKEAVRASLDLDLAAGLRLEADLSSLLQSSGDRVAADAAFREKRKPRFEGK